MSDQQSLFNAVKDVFATNSRISNKALYRTVGEQLGISETEFSQRESIGKNKQKHNVFARKVRWQQQTLKQLV